MLRARLSTKIKQTRTLLSTNPHNSFFFAFFYFGLRSWCSPYMNICMNCATGVSIAARSLFLSLYVTYILNSFRFARLLVCHFRFYSLLSVCFEWNKNAEFYVFRTFFFVAFSLFFYSVSLIGYIDCEFTIRKRSVLLCSGHAIPFAMCHAPKRMAKISKRNEAAVPMIGIANRHSQFPPWLALIACHAAL